jgi:two-component system alkaline phosphatase synthesis response regulator PhoP
MNMGKRILIVDDEDELVKAIQIRLQHAGYETIVAYDGMEGLDKARKENPDLILLDLMLPKMDGYKVCCLLKRDKKYRNIPIIMLTARTLEKDKRQGFELDADAYITKPFQYEVVLAKIKELLGEQVI